MTTETISLPEYKHKLATNRLGLWLFILSDIFLFVGLLVTRFYLLGAANRPDVNQYLGLVVTSDTQPNVDIYFDDFIVFPIGCSGDGLTASIGSEQQVSIPRDAPIFTHIDGGVPGR